MRDPRARLGYDAGVGQKLRIGVVAPSGPYESAPFEAGLAALESLGLTPVRFTDGLDRTPYLAGDDPTRAARFLEALHDPKVDILIAARGGYGAQRLLGPCDRFGPPDRPKCLVGFSDISAFAGHFFRSNVRFLHGPVVTQLAKLSGGDQETLKKWVTPESPTEHCYHADGPVIAPGTACGTVFGGCLSVLVHQLGTPYWPRLRGELLLLEDVGEAPYRIDRMLTHLENAGVFDAVSGILLGDFTGCVDARRPSPTVTDVLHERLGHLGIPVLAGLPFGHGERNAAVPFWGTACLDGAARCLRVSIP